jgi:hypothetical protein
MVTVTSNLRSIVDHDGAVILDIHRNAMITLDATGAYVWQKLQRGLQIDAIISDLARDTGADEVMIAKDVDAFMDQLKSSNLVTTIDAGHTEREPQHG